MGPEILFFDIETAPNLSYVWGHWEQNVIKHEREWYILCVSYRWGVDGKTKVISLPDYDGYEKDPEDDKALCQDLWDLLDRADIVIGHNGDRFDIRKSNARFILHGMTPPSHYRTVDTLKAARRFFMFNSNSLGALGQTLGLGSKADVGGFSTWAGCMRGDKKAWRQMTKYAKQDTDLLVAVYLRLRPWITNHPNFGVWSDRPCCTKCGSEDLIRRGTRTTQVATYAQVQCKACGGYSRLRTAYKHTKPTYTV